MEKELCMSDYEHSVKYYFRFEILRIEFYQSRTRDFVYLKPYNETA